MSTETRTQVATDLPQQGELFHRPPERKLTPDERTEIRIRTILTQGDFDGQLEDAVRKVKALVAEKDRFNIYAAEAKIDQEEAIKNG